VWHCRKLSFKRVSAKGINFFKRLIEKRLTVNNLVRRWQFFISVRLHCQFSMQQHAESLFVHIIDAAMTGSPAFKM